MIPTEYDVVGVGNAIVDVIVQTNDSFLQEHGLTKGGMTIIDANNAEKLYSELGPSIKMSGGSAANTIAGIAVLGGKGVFVGKVCDDQLGKFFRKDIQAIGVRFFSNSNAKHAPTARSFVFVTPDAERTMQTFLGACVELGPEDIDSGLIAHSMVTYLEGYLWDPPLGKKAFVKAAEVAAEFGRKVSLSLSDPFCVDRHREELIDFVKNYVNIIFANEEEIKSLYLVKTFDDALQEIRTDCDIAVLTRGASGSVVASGPKTLVLEADPITRVIDTTGAGDAYAAGFLYGYTQGKDLTTCARIAGVTAAEIISHYGARPKSNLSKLVKDTLQT